MIKNPNVRAKIAMISNAADEAEVMLLTQQEKIEELEARLAARKSVIKPIPCRKFKDASMLEWIAKLTEETDEVVQEATVLSRRMATACDDVDDFDLAEELTDVITVCVSWLDALDYGEEARGDVQQYVNEKNRKRGYHDEADS